MAAPVRDWLFRNWPIKITAIVLAAVLWAVVAAEEPTTEIIPVVLEITYPQGRTLSQDLPQVQALYSGSARELFKLSGQPPSIVRSIPDTLSGSAFTLDLSVADLITPPGFDVLAVEVQPPFVRVVLDEAVEQNVPVVGRVTVGADSGFVIVGSPLVRPESVTVHGPLALVQRVESLSTEIVALDNLRGSVRRTVAIDTSGLGVMRIVPSDVEIIVEVAEIATRLIIGVPVRIRADRAGTWVTDPAAVAVTVRGFASRLRRLTRDSLQATVMISGATDEEPGVVMVTAPDGLTAIATPDTVIARRTGG